MAYEDRLRLVALWWDRKRCLALWDRTSRKIIRDCLRLLQARLALVLNPLCTHVKGHGGVKGSVRTLMERIRDFRFAARFDIASYYDSMQHHILLIQLEHAGVRESLRGHCSPIPRSSGHPSNNRLWEGSK